VILSDELSEAAGKAADQARAPVIRFRLDGTSRAYDPARQAIRPDLADIAEAASHFAPHYAAPLIMRTTRAIDLHERNSSESDALRLLDAGARFAMLDATGGWAWGYALDTHSVGYVVAADLLPDDAA
jgi:hypothetical protein